MGSNKPHESGIAEFTTQIFNFGFVQSTNDHCLFTKDCKDGFIVLILYVDDMLLTGPDETELIKVKQHLDS